MINTTNEYPGAEVLCEVLNFVWPKHKYGQEYVPHASRDDMFCVVGKHGGRVELFIQPYCQKEWIRNYEILGMREQDIYESYRNVLSSMRQRQGIFTAKMKIEAMAVTIKMCK
jgi:hypothetical protein